MNDLISIHNLSKSYGSKQVLHQINLNIGSGKIIGLLGPNASGKTTLLKIIAGLLNKYDGEFTIDGHKKSAYTKSVISYLPDEPYFQDYMKTKDIVKVFKDMYADFDIEKCERMLQRFSIEPQMKIKSMSKGTKEKLQLCLVMARNAKVILLDEPIGGVDPAAREVILDTILLNRDNNSTLIISTHLISDIERVFDEVIFLKEGNIVLHENAEVLRETNSKTVEELFKEVFRC